MFRDNNERQAGVPHEIGQRISRGDRHLELEYGRVEVVAVQRTATFAVCLDNVNGRIGKAVLDRCTELAASFLACMSE
ncbi:MAG: hypothetical protein ACREJD_06255 [Phycisphaerales bacterium]